MFVIEQGSSNLKQGGKILSMSMPKLLITLGLILLMTMPFTIAHAESSYSGSGSAVISDAGAMSNKVNISLSGLSRLEKGSAYEGWLVDSVSGEKVSVGILTSPMGSVNHSWISPDNANLLELYDCVVISVESVPDDDPAEWAEVAFMDTIDEGAIEQIRGLVVGDSSTLHMLRMQVGMAMAKVAEAQAAGSIDDLQAATEEAAGMTDGIAELASSASASAMAAMDASSRDNVDMYAKKVMSSSDNVSDWAMAAKADAGAVMAEDDLDTAKTLLNIVNGKLMAAADGIEASGMGGASDAYMQTQKMATFTLPAPAAPPEAAAPTVGDAYVPAAMQIMLFVSLMLLIGGGALLYRERRHGAKA